MSTQTLVQQNRLSKMTEYLSMAASIIDKLSDISATSFLKAISGTTAALVDGVQFTETLQKIHAFVVAQRDRNKIRTFLRQSDTSSLLKDYNAGLTEAFNVFVINHEELLELIATPSDRTTSGGGSSVSTEVESQGPDNSFTDSISLLPSKPKIFYGRHSELQEIIDALMLGPVRVAILGAAGMGESSLSRAVLHHPKITAKYKDCFFVTSDSATTSVGLAAIIVSYVGFKPGKDLTKAVVQNLSERPPCLLVLDNLETS
ncbi:hypothetical protein B0H13DRAFT_2275044 [Mycena leptocephala]|nr:hypothetical protein B0H13DRAFT_2275044 [Mycena leptocephala]